MRDRSHQVTLHLADSIVDCPTRGTSMSLPVAILARLDAMADAARRVRTSRNELLAALIATAPLQPDQLESIVDRYRRLGIADVLPGEAPRGESVVVALRQPGRPAA